MSNKLYKASFKGIRKTAKSPLYSNKNACLRWVANNSHRVLGELLVYELDSEKAKQSNDRVASAYEYPELRLDAEQTISVGLIPMEGGNMVFQNLCQLILKMKI